MQNVIITNYAMLLYTFNMHQTYRKRLKVKSGSYFEEEHTKKKTTLHLERWCDFLY